MTELTLESFTKRIEALEIALATNAPNRKDWRRVVGMFGDGDFMRAVDEECQRLRETEREAARGVAGWIRIVTDQHGRRGPPHDQPG